MEEERCVPAGNIMHTELIGIKCIYIFDNMYNTCLYIRIIN